MFCPKCGNANQNENTYCRRCGLFLPDFEKIKTKEITAEKNLQINTTLSALTGIVSLSLAVALYVVFLGRESTPFIIYLTAGFLTAMFAWQVQIFWRNILLKKQIRKRQFEQNTTQKIETSESKQLNEADFSDTVPTSVTERTTRQFPKIKVQ